MTQQAEDGKSNSFRREHPVFFWGCLALMALFLAATAAVGMRVPRYRAEARDLAERMSAEQLATRDSLLHSRGARTRLALAVLGRDMRIRSYQNNKRHLAISLRDSVMELRQGRATLRRISIAVGGDTTVRAPDGRSWRVVLPLGERHIAQLQRAPVYTVPEWYYAAAGKPIPPEPARRVEGALGAYVIRLDDGTEIYSRPSAGPFAQGVKPGSFVATAHDLATIFGALGDETPVYIY